MEPPERNTPNRKHRTRRVAAGSSPQKPSTSPGLLHIVTRTSQNFGSSHLAQRFRENNLRDRTKTLQTGTSLWHGTEQRPRSELIGSAGRWHCRSLGESPNDANPPEGSHGPRQHSSGPNLKQATKRWKGTYDCRDAELQMVPATQPCTAQPQDA